MDTLAIPARVAERAATRYEVAESGCWISTYSVASHGYAQIGWWDREVGKCRMTTAHRAAWTHVHGAIPGGLTVDHRCYERRCVNPAHLRLLSLRENARRANGRDWPLGFCANGHPDDGRRHCAACKADDQRRRRAA